MKVPHLLIDLRLDTNGAQVKMIAFYNFKNIGLDFEICVKQMNTNYNFKLILIIVQ